MIAIERRTLGNQARNISRLRNLVKQAIMGDAWAT
jgi:hypothetical protein